MELIDLTHTLKDGMVVFPGDTSPEIKQTDFIAEVGLAHFSLKTGMHAGTHIDAPAHFIEGGKKISEMPTHQFFGRGRLIDARDELTIHAGLLEQTDIKANDIIFVLTGMGANLEKGNYFKNFPEVTEEFAEELVRRGVSMLGLDTCSPDKEPYEVHKILLGSEILIAENLTNLESLLGKQFSVIALPIKIEAEAGLARVIAGVED